MNAFRLVGDLFHLVALLILLIKIWTSKSAAGLSGKSQLLMALVFTTRYADLFTHFTSPYNTLMKLFFLVLSWATVHLIFGKFKGTYIHVSDTFRVEFIVIPCAGLACLVNHDYSTIEVLWTFSVYLEAVAVLPQLFMMSKTGDAETVTNQYLMCLACYRALYILNWIYRFYTEHYFDLIAVVSGAVQTALFADFVYLYVTKEDLLLGDELEGEAGATPGQSGGEEEDKSE